MKQSVVSGIVRSAMGMILLAISIAGVTTAAQSQDYQYLGLLNHRQASRLCAQNGGRLPSYVELQADLPQLASHFPILSRRARGAHDAVWAADADSYQANAHLAVTTPGNPRGAAGQVRSFADDRRNACHTVCRVDRFEPQQPRPVITTCGGCNVWENVGGMYDRVCFYVFRDNVQTEKVCGAAGKSVQIEMCEEVRNSDPRCR